MSATQVKNTSFFKPSDIAGCAMWLDGKDPAGTGTAPANGSTVSTWTDKSRNGINLTAVGTPTYTSSNSSVYLNGSSYLQNTNFNFSNYTLFIVSNQASGVGPLYTNTSGTDVTGFFPIYGANYYLVQSDTTWLNTTTPFVNGTTYIYSIQFDSSINVWSTGSISPVITGTPGTITRNMFILGRRVIYSDTMTGNIFEVIQYNTGLSQYTRQGIEGYLAWKWGLNRSLPPTHPYYTVQSYATTLYYPKSITKITSTNITHPLAIAGLSLWLDGQDITGTGSSYPTGSTVTTWTDKSGNQRNATASSGGVSYTMTFGIYPGLVFTNSQYLLGNISITGNTLSIFSMFSLANQGTGGSGRLIGLAATGQNDYNSGSYMGLLRQSSTLFGPYRNGTFTGNTVSYDTPTIMEAWYDGTNQFSIINGGLTPLSNAFSGNFSISSYAVANNTNLGDIPNGPLYGSIGEVIVYNISPTQSQRQLIEGYLAWKWGRQASLAAGHPYQTVVPMYPPYVNPVVRSIVNRPLIPIIREGLIYHLDAGNITSYSGSGSTWTDLTGSGITMTLYGSPTYSSANGGSILFVPASSQYGQTSASLASTPVWTVEFFTYYNGTNTATSPCLYSDVFPGSASVIQTALGSLGTFGSGCCPGATVLQAGYYNGGWYVTPIQSPLVSGNWYHLVGTYDGANIKLYINAVLNQTTASATTAAGNTGGFRIMSRWDSADYWGGRVAVMRRYNRALSGAEISINYGAQKSRFGLV